MADADFARHANGPHAMKPTKSLAIAGCALIVSLPFQALAAPPPTPVAIPDAGKSDGRLPRAALINVGGTLYGTTSSGGTSENGTVFKIHSTTGVEQVVHFFKGGSDGANPTAPLINVSGTLYGTTSAGGKYGGGTVFKIDTTTGKETVVYSLGAPGDGATPYGALINLSGTLYGTTYTGGPLYGGGTVFKINIATGVETLVYSFTCCSDAAYPEAALINVGGTLYGTATEGGATGNGAVFKIDPATGVEKVVYSFAGGTDGNFPTAALIDVSGTLYGTTLHGGTAGYGTVFKVDRAAGAETILYSFAGGSDGLEPYDTLINVSGTLYGTTAAGGSSGSDGTVFKINPTTGAESVVYAFLSGNDGDSPIAGLHDVSGTLYGTTYYGGSTGYGTVFKIDPSTGAETVIYTFK
jgi:uncharacterized repeat protein (TIGR03803 family)